MGIELSKLTRADIGRAVVYRPFVGADAEDGVVSSWNDHYVFVHYKGDWAAKATLPEDLEWLRAR